jgi:hypothetical protein
MFIIKRWGLGFAVVAAALLALVVTSQASATTQNIVIGRATVEPGHSATVDLTAENISAPGLGAWEIGIFYDPSVVTALACDPQNGSVCNASFAANQVRVTGASASGLLGDHTLASITFECADAQDTTALTLSVPVVADATVGAPRDIDVKQLDGAITCTDSPFSPPPPGPTRRPTQVGPAPTPTSVVGGLPNSGTGNDANGGSGDWLMAALAAVALVTVAGVSLAAIRRRSDR